jgi:hypothetical protein
MVEINISEIVQDNRPIELADSFKNILQELAVKNKKVIEEELDEQNYDDLFYGKDISVYHYEWRLTMREIICFKILIA